MGDPRCGLGRPFYDAGRPGDKCQANYQPDQNYLTRRVNHHDHAHVQPQYSMAPCIHDGDPYCTRYGILILYLHQTFCDGGCKVIYDKREVRVMYNDKLILSGGRDTHTWACGYCRSPRRAPHSRRRIRRMPCLTCRCCGRSTANASQTTAASVYILSYKQ